MKMKEKELRAQARKFVDEIQSGERSRFRILSDMKHNIRKLHKSGLSNSEIHALYSTIIALPVVFSIATESEEDAMEFEDAVKDLEESNIENERTKNVIRYLYLQEGWSIERIAFEFNISRERTKKILGIE